MVQLVIESSLVTALFASLALSSLFVASLYLWKLAGYQDRNRNHIGTIQRRFLSSLLTCICSAGFVRALSRPAQGNERGLSFLELLGLTSDATGWAILHCIGLTAILFMGPLVQHWKSVSQGDVRLVSLFSEQPWIAARNYLMAPITEEFVFRACIVRFWVAASIPSTAIVVLSPLTFGLAHVHHYLEKVRNGESRKSALQGQAFQGCYTTLFGMYGTFLLLRTGSTTAVTLIHTFCNHHGFPDLSFFTSMYHPLYV